MQTIAKSNRYGPCPTHFRATCRQASEGGTNSYESAGYQIVMHIGNLAPDDFDPDDWERHVEELEDLIMGPSNAGMSLIQSDDAGVLAWFDLWVPSCMALIPSRRRQTFLAGVYRYVIEEGNPVGRRGCREATLGVRARGLPLHPRIRCGTLGVSGERRGRSAGRTGPEVRILGTGNAVQPRQPGRLVPLTAPASFHRGRILHIPRQSARRER
jgi:hypothetical protein